MSAQPIPMNQMLDNFVKAYADRGELGPVVEHLIAAKNKLAADTAGGVSAKTSDEVRMWVENRHYALNHICLALNFLSPPQRNPREGEHGTLADGPE